MAQYMKSDGDQEMWKRQLSHASTQLPCSPPMSRMVSPESDRDVDEFTEKIIDDFADLKFDLPDGAYYAEPSKGGVVLLPVLCGFFIYGIINSESFLILTGILAIPVLLLGFYFCVVEGCPLDHTWPAEFQEEIQAGPGDCKESHKYSQKQVASWIIDSLYHFCVYVGCFVCLAAVAVLWPWALLLLPPVYLCLLDDSRNEDCEEEDDCLQQKSLKPESSPSDPAVSLSFGVCVYTIVFVLVGVLAIVAILLPAALVFCLKD